MTDILCKWLNEELHISKQITPATFAHEFSSGYLLGEVLYRHQLQDDFDQFSSGRTADSKLNNFTLLEPMLHLLSIPFNITFARDIMTEKHGAATRLLSQVYIALNNKKSASLSQIAMKTLQAAASAKLGAIESEIFKERLKHATPRQTDLNLQALVDRFHEHQIQIENLTFKERFEESERLQQQRQKERQYLLDRTRTLKEKQAELAAKINASMVHIPKPPSTQTLKAIQAQKELRRKREAEETISAIHDFEEKLKAILPPNNEWHGGDEASSDFDLQFNVRKVEDQGEATHMMKVTPNHEYILKIRKRLQDDAMAREEREKRRRKVLNDQMNSHHQQEEMRREEMLVNRLLRQSQQERRIVVQLLQARHEKEVIIQNRILREKQYQEAREKDFQDALNREAELVAQRRLLYAEQIKQDQDLHNQIAAEWTELRYRRHYNMCAEIVDGILDFASMVTMYRQITNNLVPAKLMREWKLLFTHGQPLFDPVETEEVEFSPELILEEERQQLLDEGDLMEYRSMTGEWLPPESCDTKEPPRDNPVVNHIVQKLFSIAHPPTPPAMAPDFPSFPIRVCVLGKAFSGKTTCLNKLIIEHNILILEPEILVQEAVEAHKSQEVETLHQETQVNFSDQESQSMSTTEIPAEPEVDQTDDAAKETEPVIPDAAVNQPVSGSTVEGISDVDSVKSKTSGHSQILSAYTRSQPTVRAKLGSKAMKCLKKGRPVDDQVMVDILVTAIRQVPEGTGWILNDYPRTYNQAKILEKALSGCDGSATEKNKESRKTQRSNLISYPLDPQQLQTPPSGIDVVILFDIRDELCLKRAAGRYEKFQGEEVFHEEFNPPPEGSATGVGKTEKVRPISDPYYDEQQIQTRLSGFLHHWPKLQKWFLKYGTLKTVDASLEKEAVFLETEKILQDTIEAMKNIEQQEEVLAEEKQEEKEQAPGGPPEIVPIETVAEVPAPGGPDDRESRPETKSNSRAKTEDAAVTEGSKISGESKQSKKSKLEEEITPIDKISSEKLQPERKPSSEKQELDVEFNIVISVALEKGSAKSGSSQKDKKSKSPKGKKSESGSPKRKGSRGASSVSGKKKSNISKVHETEPEPEPVELVGPPPPKPGDDDWIFVDLNIDLDLAKVLMAHWEEIEKAYINNFKFVFRNIRLERENILKYFFQIRKNYIQYLKKPDCKQEYVSQWQKIYNEVADDMRDDEEVRAELHQQVDDLVERLWSICDERKEQAEMERMAIIKDGWLDDRLGILSNHYLTMMQIEVDRFQDTVRLLKDYYRGMDGLVPEALNSHYERVPLIELLYEKEEKQEKTISDLTHTEDDKSEHLGKSQRQSPGTKDSKTGLAKKKTNEKDEESLLEGIGYRVVIPLVPQYSLSGDLDKLLKMYGRDSKEKNLVKKGRDDLPSDNSALTHDADDRQIFEVYSIAVSAISQMLQAEMMIKEAEEEATKLRDSDKEKEKAKSAKGAKGAKKIGSPGAKKVGKGKEAETSLIQISGDSETSEEELQKKMIKLRAKEELYFSIQEESKLELIRLELIHLVASTFLQNLKIKAEEAFKAMNDWLGAKFLKEMECIDQMALVMHNAVEHGEKLKNEIVLEVDNFILDEDLKVLKSPSPEPPSTPVEEPMSDQFTVDQVKNLYEQLGAIAPTGIISKKAFTEMFESLVSVSQGMESLPELWMLLTSSQIQELSNALSSESDYVDWRHLLVALCYPIPTPTQQELLECLRKFKKMDQKNTGTVTREQWHWINFWFSASKYESDVFDRVSSLKKLLFEMFADHSEHISVINYVSFLMYFSVIANYHEGFLRALSVATGQHMPRLDKPLLPIVAQVQKSQNSAGEISEAKEEDNIPAELPMSDEVIPPESQDAEVSLEALFKVLHHGDLHSGDSHRFSVTADPEDHRSIERLAAVFQELNDDDSTDPIMYRVLIEHPLIQDVVVACKQFKALDLKSLVSRPLVDVSDLNSLQVLD